MNDLKKLRQSLAGLDVRENPEERVTYQVMDLQLIKYKGIQTGDILPNDVISQAIDKITEGFIWFYEQDYSLKKNVQELLKNEEGKARYDEFLSAFSTFNDFMRIHMHLKDE